MKYRKLGKTGLAVSEIGFGAWGIGGGSASYGPVNDDESKRTLQLAFDNGVTLYDTADSYGNGHSEELIGETFKNVRDKIIIATKVGCLPHREREMPQDFSVKYIRQSIEASLKRLQTDCIDLYQLHSPPVDILASDGFLKTLEDLKKEGKVKVIGVSARSPDDGLIAVKEYGFGCVQVNFNLIDHRVIENGLLDIAKRENVGIIVRTPLCFGFLTGDYSENTEFAPEDHRLNWPKEQLERWTRSVDLFASLCAGKNRTPAQLALRFCLSYEGVSTVIPGMMNRKEVEENVKSSDLEDLSEEELTTIRRIYETNVFFDPSLKR
ncbi:MAG: aldo/keto reductase [Dehalococcoidia bacterium]|nr:MAG: aldo/keto reductase [Dehalococcoidia bacterium]